MPNPRAMPGPGPAPYPQPMPQPMPQPQPMPYPAAAPAPAPNAAPFYGGYGYGGYGGYGVGFGVEELVIEAPYGPYEQFIGGPVYPEVFEEVIYPGYGYGYGGLYY